MTPIRTLFVPSCGWTTLAASVFLIVPSKAEAGSTITARTASFVDVSSAVALAHDGDTVIIPAGTASWISKLTINKGITLQGATTVNTTGAGGANVTGSANDQTIILDNVVRDAGANAPILDITLTPSQSFRLSGITLRAGSLATGAGNGAIRIHGLCPSVRIDHIHFDGLHQDFINATDGATGVIDHCLSDATQSGGYITFGAGSWGGAAYGDGSWADSAHFGSDKFLFIEDCILNNGRSVQTNGNLDTVAGARYVARHNTFNNCLANTHGTESGGRRRGSRAIEIYNNTFQFTIPGNATGGQLRAGTALIHDNAYIGNIGSGMTLQVYREWANFSVWGNASGMNGLDSNDSTNPHQTSTVSSATSGTITDNNANWTPNQWVGYMLYNSTTNRGSCIKSNTSKTITYLYDTTYGVNLAFTSGAKYAINKVLIALDQVGRGKGDLLTGDTPVNSLTGTVAWPHQALEPVYSWNNKLNGSNVNIGASNAPTLQENRDYFNNTPMPGYTPYTYPHPLVTGVPAPPAPPAPPTNLRVSP
jgi:hypothetical protein